MRSLSRVLSAASLFLAVAAFAQMPAPENAPKSPGSPAAGSAATDPTVSGSADKSPAGWWKTIDDKTGKAKSIVHITVAGLMDWLALSHRNALPHTFWPNEERGTIVAYPEPFWTEHKVKMFLVLFALTMIAIVVISRWKDIRALLHRNRSDMLQS